MMENVVSDISDMNHVCRDHIHHHGIVWLTYASLIKHAITLWTHMLNQASKSTPRTLTRTGFLLSCIHQVQHSQRHFRKQRFNLSCSSRLCFDAHDKIVDYPRPRIGCATNSITDLLWEAQRQPLAAILYTDEVTAVSRFQHPAWIMGLQRRSRKMFASAS